MKKNINIKIPLLLFVLLCSMASTNAQMFGGLPVAKKNVFFTSCNQIKIANPSSTDGIYTIDPDGSGSAFGSMQVYCDMTRNGGGWTLIAKSMTANSDFVYSSTRWSTGQVLNPNDFDITSTSTVNSLYDAYNSVSATVAWVDFLSTPDPGLLVKSTAMTAKSMATGTQHFTAQSFTCNDCSPFINCLYSQGSGAYGMGFNLVSIIRFGHISNNESDWSSPDAATGFGLWNRNAGHSWSSHLEACGSHNNVNDSSNEKTLLWVR